MKVALPLALVGFVALAHASSDARSLQSTLLCRCEASHEEFYNRRLSGGSRQLNFDYSDATRDENGFVVVEGVTVLPSTNAACSSGEDRLLKGKRGKGYYRGK